MDGAITATAIAPRTRGYHIAAKGKSVGRRGPKRREGRREPSGRLSRANIEERVRDALDRDERETIAVGIEARVRLFGVPVSHSRDQKAGSFVGRLCLSGELSQAQYDAAQVWLEDRANYLWSIGDISPKLPGAVNLNTIRGKPTGGENVPAVRRARKRYEEACEAIQKEQDALRLSGHLFGALNYAVERDLALFHMIPDVRLALNALARHYRLDGSRKAAYGDGTVLMLGA